VQPSIVPLKRRVVRPIARPLLPELIDRGLAAHDQVKYFLALLQHAAAHADTPGQAPATLRAEREAGGVADASLDSIVAASRSVGKDVVHIPGGGSIVGRVFANIRQMLEPIQASAATRGDLRARADGYQQRLNRLLTETNSDDGDKLTTAVLAAMTRRGNHGVDSAHQLATDLRWELNRLQANVVLEPIDGADTYGLTEADRMLVRAFMKGVHETAALKFDHPGLRTTSTRDRDHLSIRNDLGPAGAHVQIRVGAHAVTVIYTDRHGPHLQFFHDLMRPYELHWDAPTGHGAVEHVSGEYHAESPDALEAFLSHVGSRLVFLIDWNLARRRLSHFVKSEDAVNLLTWAADNNIGHRAFLQAGDVHLVHSALERAAPALLRNGSRLDDLLGRDAARLFLMAVLRIASTGIAGGRSPRLIDDEIEAELLLYIRRSDRTLLGAAADHATVMAAAIEWIAHGVTRLKRHESRLDSAAAVSLIRTWRTRADEFARRTSRLIDHSNELHHFRRLMTDGDHAVKSLEHAAFSLTLIPAETDPALLSMLDSMCALVSNGIHEYVRLLEEARDLTRSPARSDLERFLVTVDRLVALDEHCDAAERLMLERLIRGPADFRELHLMSGIARHLDVAFDALVRSSLMVRDHVLGVAPGS
jgi:uncharacterized protein Yka (UPF0111/DUF47 family)